MNRDDTPHLRPAVPDDAPAVAAIHSASWRDVYAPLVSGTLPEALEADHRALWARVLAAEPHRRLVLVAEAGGRLAGFAAAHPDPDDPAVDYLAALHMHPDARGQGTGAALMAALADALAARGRTRLWCYVMTANHAARRFYARLGATERPAEPVALIEGVRTEDLRLDFPAPDRLADLARAVLATRR